MPAPRRRKGEIQHPPKHRASEKKIANALPREAHVGVDSGGTLRAGIFGINDGLVSNASLILGVAGATAEAHFILIAGIAGLLAGSFSMASGEWISMQSQRELFQREIAIEKRELRDNPEYEIEELAAIYRSRGMPRKQAEAAARAIMRKPKHALEVHAREELGLNPNELGSPWKAAGSSFIMFTVGALIPLAPFFFTSGTPAIIISAVLSGLALFIIGAVLGKFTKKNWLYTGIRMLVIGGASALVVHFVGKWLGVNVN